MAIYHCSVKVGSRSKCQSAIAAAAYRAGEKLTDHETGFVSDYTKKGGVVYSEIALCENAPAEYADRQTLWSAVHQIEKAKDARLWREIEVALPKEFSRSDQIETVRDFVKHLTDQGMCADWSLHDKGDGNPHAHIMLTTRSIKPDGTWAPKSRKVYDLDENGEKIFQKIDKTGRKQYKCHKEDYNNWNASERVEEWRAAWAECCNARLTEQDRIDHRSYARQGIDQQPTIHEGYTARKIAAAGHESDRVRANVEIRERNRLLRSLVSQLKAIGERIKRLIAGRPHEFGFRAENWEIPYLQREMRADELEVRFEKRSGTLYGIYSEEYEEDVKAAKQRFADKITYLDAHIKFERTESGFRIQDTRKQFSMSFRYDVGRAEFSEQMSAAFGYDENTAQLAAAKFIQETLKPEEKEKFISQKKVSSVRHLIALRNDYIRQGLIFTWLRANPVVTNAQEDLKQVKMLEGTFEECVTAYFKSVGRTREYHRKAGDMSQSMEEYRLDQAAQALQKHLGFTIAPVLEGNPEYRMRSHIERIRKYAKHNMERKQKAADAEFARNKRAEVLMAENITEDSVQNAFRAYEQACAKIPDSLWQEAQEAVMSGDTPMPFGSLDRASIRFYREAMERVYETAVNLMHVPTDCDQQEPIEKEDNGFYMGRTR